MSHRCMHAERSQLAQQALADLNLMLPTGGDVQYVAAVFTGSCLPTCRTARVGHS